MVKPYEAFWMLKRYPIYCHVRWAMFWRSRQLSLWFILLFYHFWLRLKQNKVKLLLGWGEKRKVNLFIKPRTKIFLSRLMNYVSTLLLTEKGFSKLITWPWRQMNYPSTAFLSMVAWHVWKASEQFLLIRQSRHWNKENRSTEKDQLPIFVTQVLRITQFSVSYNNQTFDILGCQVSFPNSLVAPQGYLKIGLLFHLHFHSNLFDKPEKMKVIDYSVCLGAFSSSQMWD